MQPPTGGALDLAKAAKLLSDITAVSDETDLSGLAAVSAEDAFLKAAGEQIRSQAQVIQIIIFQDSRYYL